MTSPKPADHTPASIAGQDCALFLICGSDGPACARHKAEVPATNRFETCSSGA